MGFSNTSLQLNKALIAIWRSLRLNLVLAFILKYMPLEVSAWIQRHKPQVRQKLVPELELREKYIEGLKVLAQRHGVNGLGDYLEVGVFQGTSLICMHRALEELRFGNARLIGFDSFEGLPARAATDDYGYWLPGQFKSSFEFTQQVLSSAGVDWDRLILVKGWYSDTLTQTLIDKYKFCAPLIRDEAMILFDDWNTFGLASTGQGEKRAFDEFLSENTDLTAEEFGSITKIARFFWYLGVNKYSALRDGSIHFFDQHTYYLLWAQAIVC